MKWKGKRVAVVGLGVSNLALARYLVDQGAHVTACDQLQAQALGPRYEAFSSLAVEFRLGPQYLDDLTTFDTVFLTPGMRKDQAAVEAARATGVEISSETKLFFSRCQAPVIGVTGSSGKTTTTHLIGEILASTGARTFVGGNIGRPLIDVVDSIPKDAWVVLELSSFQLELLDRSPHIAVVTNIAPNHLDVHRSMDAYVSAKARVYEAQSETDWAVFNLANDYTQQMAREAPSQVRWFSREGDVPDGAQITDGRFLLARERIGGRTLEEVCTVSDIKLLGDHNLENVLASLVVGDLCGAAPGAMRDVVTSFTGVAHRLELVRVADGVSFYNDSIATSPDRAMAGIASFDAPIVLIAGGYDKQIPFDAWAEMIVDRVKVLILLGASAPKIRAAVKRAADAAGRAPRLIEAANLEEAVDHSCAVSVAGDVVLLSPGCASFDMFPNFEARGEQFRDLVQSRTEETSAASHHSQP